MKTRTINTVEAQLSNAMMAVNRYEREYGYADGERKKDNLGDAIITKREEIFNLEAELCELKGLE